MSRRRGFTLIELLLVVAILGLLAGALIAAIGDPAADAREVALKVELRSLRTQLATYQLQHGGSLPDPARLQVLMTARTDASGNILSGASSGALGPYLQSFPQNPYNRKNDLKVLNAEEPLTPDDTTGWLYRVEGDGAFAIVANTTRSDRSGKPLSEY